MLNMIMRDVNLFNMRIYMNMHIYMYVYIYLCRIKFRSSIDFQYNGCYLSISGKSMYMYVCIDTVCICMYVNIHGKYMYMYVRKCFQHDGCDLPIHGMYICIYICIYMYELVVYATWITFYASIYRNDVNIIRINVTGISTATYIHISVMD